MGSYNMSLLAQMIVKFVGKAVSLPKRSLDKDIKKPTEEAAVSPNLEKSLVPKEKEESTSASSLTKWDGLLNLIMMMGVVIILKLLLGLLVGSNIGSKYDEVFPAVNFVPKIELLLSRRQIRWECALVLYVVVITTGLAMPVVS